MASRWNIDLETDVRGIGPTNALSGRENLATLSARTNFLRTVILASNAKHSAPLNLSSLLYNIQHFHIGQNFEQVCRPTDGGVLTLRYPVADAI